MASKNIKLSIIIPAYNCEKTIEKCLNSIFLQSRNIDYEVIIVDDGSTDNSVKVIQSLIQDKDNYLLIQQENAGPGVARNNALLHANGEYIVFVDSDDYITKEYFNVFFSEITEHPELEIIQFAYKYFNESNKSFSPMPERDARIYHDTVIFDKNFTFSEYPQIIECIQYPWNKIYKKELIKNKNIKFPAIFMQEDMVFTIACLINSHYIKIINNVIYIHVVNRLDGQATQVMDSRRLDAIVAINQCDGFFNNKFTNSQILEYQAFKFDLLGWIISSTKNSIQNKFISYFYTCLKNLPANTIYQIMTHRLINDKVKSLIKMKDMKILVCYHKPAKLYKDDVFVPIHVGRACPSSLSEEEQSWMHENMIGDDTGDNISALNHHFCEMTAIYWAWKNYALLGNPEYIGLCHYRRIINKEDCINAVNFDITASVWESPVSIGQQFIDGHHTDDLDQAVAMLDPSFHEVSKKYLSQNKGYFHNIFIMKKEMFFEYCKTIFPILFQIHKNINYSTYTQYNQRMPGFIAERLTGIFIKNKEKSNSIQKIITSFNDVPAVMPLHPRFQDGVCICFASDDKYVKYLDVALISVKENRNPSDNYDICILDQGISAAHRQQLLRLFEESFSIRFINIAGIFAEYDESIFSVYGHFTLSTYSRFFIPDIFREYKKVLYLDCGIIVSEDLAKLYNIDLDGFYLAAVRDVEMLRVFENDERGNGHTPLYLKNTLKLTDPTTYLQAGVLLLDIIKLRQFNFMDKCISELRRIGKPIFNDQCTINAVFNGAYKRLEHRWNVMWHITFFNKDLDKQLDMESYTDYMTARKVPAVIHYSSAIKPWTHPEVEMADTWWHYARRSSFYEEFLADIAHNDILNLKQEMNTIRGEFHESHRYAKRIAKFLVPNRIKPFLKAILRRIPQGIKTSVKRLLRW